MAQTKKQLRNLAQYRSMTDEEFERFWEERDNVDTSDSIKSMEDRISKKLEEFSQDYDLEDLKINDRESLRALIQAVIALEDYERFVYEVRASGDLSPHNINVIDRVEKIMSDLRKGISSLQDDLDISRKKRKLDKESSVINYIASLKEQARQYYESKMSYIFCPECSMLLATLWVLYPESDNKITLVCNRPMADGSKCGHKFSVTTKELLEGKGTNKPEVTPESLL